MCPFVIGLGLIRIHTHVILLFKIVLFENIIGTFKIIVIKETRVLLFKFKQL